MSAQLKPFTASALVVALGLAPVEARACGGYDCKFSSTEYEFPKRGVPWLLRSSNMPSQRAAVIVSQYFEPEAGAKVLAALAATEESSYDPGCGRSRVLADAFVGALAADTTIVSRHAILRQLRLDLLEACGDKLNPLLTTLEGLAMDEAGFVGYLRGAGHFYAGHNAEALTEFKALRTAKNPWVKETAAYLEGRALLRSAEQGWDGYTRDPNSEYGIKLPLLQESKQAFDAYLVAYPNGLYKESATGVERHLLYLQGRNAELNLKIFAKVRKDVAAKDVTSLGTLSLRELNYVRLDFLTLDDFPATTPVLAAAYAPKIKAPPREVLKKIEAASAAYAAYPGLLPLLRAELLLLAQSPKEVLLEQDVPGTPPGIKLALDDQRVRAYQASGAHAQGLVLLREMVAKNPSLGGQLDVQAREFAMIRASKDFASLYVPGSALFEPETMDNIYQYTFTNDELESVLKLSDLPDRHRHLAAKHLVGRLLEERRYDAFLERYEALGKPDRFSEVETAARALAKDPEDAAGLFNTGYFILTRLLAPEVFDYCCVCELLAPEGQRESVRQTNHQPPVAYYVQALKNLAKHPNPDLEPKVLYYAIQCFRPTNEGYACRGSYENKDFPVSLRQGWFKRLKKTYGSTKWAKQTSLYF